MAKKNKEQFAVYNVDQCKIIGTYDTYIEAELATEKMSTRFVVKMQDGEWRTLPDLAERLGITG